MSTRLTGRVLFQGDPGFDLARRGFATAVDYDAATPFAVVYAQDAKDVCNAVKYARENKKAVRARAGAHSYAAYSSLVKDGIVIDVSEMEQVNVSSKSTTAWIGAGIDMLELTERLAESGFCLPLATGPSVGLAGLVQGGGFGINSRKYGLTADRVRAIEYVDANGKLNTASKRKNADIFWAMRGGGGGNFGIVTRFEFDLCPAGLVSIFQISYTWDAFEAVVELWQKWAPNTDWGISSLLSLRTDYAGGGEIVLEGQFTPNDPSELGNLSTILAPMLQVPPIGIQIQAAPSVIAARLLFGVDLKNPSWAIRQHGDNQLFKSASSVANDYFSTEAIAKLKHYLDTVPKLSATPSQPSMVQLLSGGGQMAKPSIESTAVVHRNAKFMVQYDGYWTAPQDAEPTINWVVDMRHVLLDAAGGAYVNYQDPALGANFANDYYGVNLKRLIEVKKKHDPENFFSFPQSIPLK
jgi:FAD/FMN-containing dehydrogenase